MVNQILRKFFIFFVISISLENFARDEISIKGNHIHINGDMYFMKGICYHPVPIGETKRSFANLEQDLALMVEAGINTIRVYEPIDDLSVLNAIDEAGLKVIISFGYNNPDSFDIVTGGFVEYIQKYKEHNAILLWELGNEYNYHPEWFGGDISIWYKTLDIAAGIVQIIDETRPVSTAHGELPQDDVLEYGKNIDIWGINVYRWDKPASILREWRLQKVKKPMYYSEAGGDSYMTTSQLGYLQGESQEAQADANKNILKEIFKNKKHNAGVMLFQFTDGWWKAGNPSQQDKGGAAPNSGGVPYDGSANEEYWGIVDIDRKKKLTFEVVKEIYNQE